MIVYKIRQFSPGAEKLIPIGRHIGAQLVDALKASGESLISKRVHPFPESEVFVVAYKLFNTWMVELYLVVEEALPTFVLFRQPTIFGSYGNYFEEGMRPAEPFAAAQSFSRSRGYTTSPVREKHPLVMLRKFIALKMWGLAWWVCNSYFSTLAAPCAYLKTGWDTEVEDGTRVLVIDLANFVPWNFWSGSEYSSPTHDTELITTDAGYFAIGDFFNQSWFDVIPGAFEYMQSLVRPSTVDYDTLLKATVELTDFEKVFVSAAPAGKTFFGTIVNDASTFFADDPLPVAPIEIDDYWNRPIESIPDSGQLLPPTRDVTMYRFMSGGRLFAPVGSTSGDYTQEDADAAFATGGGIRANGVYQQNGWLKAPSSGPFDHEDNVVFYRWTCNESHGSTPPYSLPLSAPASFFVRTGLSTSYEHVSKTYQRTVNGHVWIATETPTRVYTGYRTATEGNFPTVDESVAPEMNVPHYHVTQHEKRILPSGEYTFKPGLHLYEVAGSILVPIYPSTRVATLAGTSFVAVPSGIIESQFSSARGWQYRLYVDGSLEILDPSVAEGDPEQQRTKFSDVRPARIESPSFPEGVWNISMPFMFAEISHTSTWTVEEVADFLYPKYLHVQTASYYYLSPFSYAAPAGGLPVSKWPVIFPQTRGAMREAVPYKSFVYDPYSGDTLIARHLPEEEAKLASGTWLTEDTYYEQFNLWQLRYNWLLNPPTYPNEPKNKSKATHLDAFLSRYDIVYSRGNLPPSALMHSYWNEGLVLIV